MIEELVVPTESGIFPHCLFVDHAHRTFYRTSDGTIPDIPFNPHTQYCVFVMDVTVLIDTAERLEIACGYKGVTDAGEFSKIASLKAA